MKHLLSILLLICLHMPCATSEASREPILFRDIPWGVSITDAFKYLENDSLPLSTLSFVDRTATPFEQECFYEDHSTKDCFFQIYYGPYGVKKNPQLFVGGYIVCSMTLDAIAGINANGAISESADDSMLYHCTYNFGHWKDDEKEEAQAVFDDLARKLSVLYGEGFYETDRKELGNDSYWLIDDTVTWFGSDHTAVVLTHSYISDYITIDYWNTGCCEEFQAVINVQTGEYNAALDTSGL